MSNGDRYRLFPTVTEETNLTVSIERPSSFREMLYRDRRLVSRSQLDRRIASRVAERDEAEEDGDVRTQPSYFPTLSRALSRGSAGTLGAAILVATLIVGAFLLGRWVGQQAESGGVPESAAVVNLT